MGGCGRTPKGVDFPFSVVFGLVVGGLAGPPVAGIGTDNDPTSGTTRRPEVFRAAGFAHGADE